LNNCHQVCS